MGVFAIFRTVRLATLWGILYVSIGSVEAQDFWQPIREASIPGKTRAARAVTPRGFSTYRLKTEAFKEYVSTAPLRDLGATRQTGIRLVIPDPAGRKLTFDIVREQVMAPELEAKFPGIRSFMGTCIEEPGLSLRLEYGPKGVTGMVFAPEGGTYLIDPFSDRTTTEYQVFYRRDVVRDPKKMFQCLTEGTMVTDDPIVTQSVSAGTCGTLRTYDMAIAASAEYTAFHSLVTDTEAEKKTKALAAINTAVNRLNQVFQTEFSIRLLLVANTDLLIYTDASTDPYNGDPESDINTNVTITNTAIGISNYDWGHLFGAASLSGLAYAPSVCKDYKAGGVTGLATPTGDPFVIDYVAHEMGHQMSAMHTQYNACNRDNASSMEPGSASTIMGYAGICAPNVQVNSDPYFHARSIHQIVSYMHSGDGSACATATATSNARPIVFSPQSDRTIPKGTPFSLAVGANDPDLDGLTYCWEQMDALGSSTPQPMPPVGTNTNGPMFRSHSPSTSSTRWFPALATVNMGATSSTWEVLPTVSRTLNFRGTVRDNRSDGGCTTEDDVVVTVDGNSGPFVVTSPNTAVTWKTTYKQKVKWNVAATNLAPVNCSQVDILLSTDGGLTYPVMLASAVPNTGSADVTVPANPGSQNRIKVLATGNIFYDVSNTNFTVETASVQDYQIWADTDSKYVCGQTSTSYSIDILSVLGFSGNVSLSVSGLPAGVTHSFGSSTVATGSSTTLTLNNLGGLVNGTYSFSVDGSGTPGSRSLTLELNVSASSLPVTLGSPADNAAGVSWRNPSFSWTAVAGALNYDIQVSTDTSFSTLVVNQTGLSTPSHTHSGDLSASTGHWWRVRANSTCLTGAYSIRSFTTSVAAQTVTYNSGDVPKTISPATAATYNSTLAIPLGGTLLDVDVVSVGITHTWIEDLTIKVKHPDNTQITLFDATRCGDSDNISMGFDDESTNTNASIPCPPTNGNNYVPDQALSAFDGKAGNGTWTLSVIDNYAQDGGSINSWGLRLTVLPVYKWSGSTNTDWNTASNWIPGVPPTNADIEIPASLTNYPAMDQDRTIANLTIASGARLDLNGKTLTVIGTFSGSGTIRGSATSSLAISGNSGTVNFDQSTPGTTNVLKDLTLSGSATTTLGNALNITGGSTPGTVTIGGTAVLASSGNLTLKSDGTGTARIAASTGSVTGNVNVERYIPAKASRKWVFLASPVTQPAGQFIRNGWQQQVFITGSGSNGIPCGNTTGNGTAGTDRYNTNGFDVTVTNAASIFTYSPTLVNGSRWTGVANTTSTALTRGRGYRLNIRGPRGASDANCASQLNSATPSSPAAVTLSVTGTVGIGAVNMALNDFATHPYTLIGNPYPSQIDFSTFQSANSSKITNGFWTYSPTLSANTYTTYNSGSITNGAAGWDNTNGALIASGQAFFVQGLSGATSVDFAESHKTGSSIPNTNYFRENETWDQRVMVGLKTEAGEHLDETLIRFKDHPMVGSDVGPYDAISFNSGTFIAGQKSGRPLAIQTRPKRLAQDTVRLTVATGNTGRYRLGFSEYEAFSEDIAIFLHDRMLGRMRNIRRNNGYPFETTSDPLSRGEERFELLFRPARKEPVEFNGIAASRIDGDVKVRWMVGEENDLAGYEIQRSSDGRDFRRIGYVVADDLHSYEFIDKAVANGKWQYRVRTVEKSPDRISYSAVAKIDMGASDATMNIYPNPVDGLLSILLSNAASPPYNLRVIASDGRTVWQLRGILPDGRALQVNTADWTKGGYIVELRNNRGETVIERFIRR